MNQDLPTKDTSTKRNDPENMEQELCRSITLDSNPGGDDDNDDKNSKNEKEKQKSSRKINLRARKCERLCLMMFICFVPVSLITLLSAYLFFLPDVSTVIPTLDGLKFIEFNIHQNPIMSLQFSDSECPEGTEQADIGSWKGVKSGCYCSTKTESKLHPEQCTQEQLNANCIGVGRLKAQTFHKWQKDVLCITRATKDKDYIVADHCPKGYTDCFEGLCFNSTIGCPITSITVKDSFSKGYIQLGKSDKYLDIEHKSDKSPIVSLSVQAQKHPCYESEIQPRFKSEYPLLIENTGCGKYGSDDYNNNIIQKSTFNDWVKENGIDMQKLPEFAEITKDEHVYFSARSRINTGESQECTEYANQTYSFQIRTYVPYLLKYSQIVGSIIILFLHMIVVVIWITVKKKKLNLDTSTIRKHVRNLLFAEFFTILLSFGLYMWSLWNFIEVKDAVSGLLYHDCLADDVLINILEDYMSFIDRFPSILHLGYFIFAASSAFLYICFRIFSIRASNSFQLRLRSVFRLKEVRKSVNNSFS